MYVHVPLFFIDCSCQVLCATFDEASVNRRLAKLQDTHAKLLYKVLNINAEDGRELFFLSDVPHLIMTVWNCLHSKARSPWVCHC